VTKRFGSPLTEFEGENLTCTQTNMNENTANKRQRSADRGEKASEQGITRESSSLKEAAKALAKDTILHELLPRFNPFKLADLQEVLSLREVFVDAGGSRVRVITDADLKEFYFETTLGFRKDEFTLANWREMKTWDMVWHVKQQFKHLRFTTYSKEQREYVEHPLVYPPGKLDPSPMTKEDIARMYSELTYMPERVYRTAIAGAHVLRLVKAGDVIDGEEAKRYLKWACCAGLDASVIRGLARKCDRKYNSYARDAAQQAAMGGHTDVLDLLASEFGAEIGGGCLIWAARLGHNAMIDHLVEKYGLDPNDVAGGSGKKPIHVAVFGGRARTVQHLVEKHNVDIQARLKRFEQPGWREVDGKNASELALSLADNPKVGVQCAARTEIATYLQGKSSLARNEAS